ncbi:putative endo-1,3(4)-beta-glucanase [Tolypocladium ophioglossoides CBS 100239]|uniref:endo-1,3(4)-beta-glucanase n=1 Tax=Tolypocladium ophioglossoides (strain CBS 100239) TaxID=1163406 RepID=A0A0L0NNW9_TOLOC|nr:putative endo-1,3(4)-beta-glucanase [Tolypocladium ophioglossoides CBS 100239]
MHVSGPALALALGAAALLAAPARAKDKAPKDKAPYALSKTYDTTNFFTEFDFFTGPDPTHGFVEYVDGPTAQKQALAGIAQSRIGNSSTVIMGVDYETPNPPNGRRSVRVSSRDSFNHGLFVADIVHMPGSICGVWPAFWMFGPNWPASGEIDIIEGVNTQATDTVTLHTSPGCSVSNAGALASTVVKSSDCNSGNANGGCGQQTADEHNYGDGFNRAGGGVYATEWTSDHIAVWFFQRAAIPRDLAAARPDPASWGPPLARFAGGQGCDIDSHFVNNQLVFDITLCGDWAGNPSVWAADPTCSAKAATCAKDVANNPADFKDAFWEIHSVKVYQPPAAGKRAQPATAATAAAGPTRRAPRRTPRSRSL